MALTRGHDAPRDALRRELLLAACEASPLWEVGWVADQLLSHLPPSQRRLTAAATVRELVAQDLVLLAEHHPGDLLPVDHVTIGPPDASVTLPGPVYDYGKDTPFPRDAVDSVLAEPNHWEPGALGHEYVVLLLTEAGEQACHGQTVSDDTR
jgi:hypothetical protein